MSQIDPQDPRSAFPQSARPRMVQVKTTSTRPSTFWEFLATGREEQTTVSYSVMLLR